MAVRELDPKIKKLRDEGKTLWSYSKLGTYNNCPYGYYKTYIERDIGKDNLYSVLGSQAHDILEEAYNTGKYNSEHAVTRFKIELDRTLNSGYRFSGDEKMNTAIYKNYVTSMTHYFEHFELEKFKSKQEGLVLAHLFDDHYIHGYYDQVRRFNESFEVIDFKTSTEFKKDERWEKARQLILYADILSKNSKFNIDKVAWAMLKYVKVSYKLKNGNTKERILMRSKIVSELSKQLEKDLKDLKVDDLFASMYIDEAIARNDLEKMPDEIRTKYTIEPWYDYYEYTEEDVKEVYEYIRGTIEKIMAEKEWRPNLDSSYFCNELCNHRDSCPHLAEANGKRLLDTTDDEWCELL